MTVVYVATGKTAVVSDAYGARLIEQGAAKPAKAVRKRGERNVAGKSHTR